MKKEALGTILAIIAALISGVSIMANKLFIVDMEPVVFTAVRALFIGIIFFMLLSYSSWGRNKVVKKNKAKDRAKVKANAPKKIPWKYYLAIGIIGGAFAFLLFFSGLKLTTGGRAAFLQKTMPLYITVLALVFLKEKISRKQLGAMLLMFLGMIAIYYATISPAELWANPSMGDLMVIGAAFLWAVEAIIAKRVMVKGESNLMVSFARMFIGAIVLFAFLAAFGNAESLNLTAQQITNLSISTALLFGYVFFWYYSMKLINVSKASALLLIAPVISMALGVMFLSEPVAALQLIGSAMILIGSYIVIKIRSELATGV